jgi:2-methylisocitrate lyase-like PEP mutase family enzyme
MVTEAWLRRKTSLHQPMAYHMAYHTRAAAFRALHHGPRILVVPNAWDAMSARLFEIAGFACVGTTSAGIAWSLGYPDGEKIPRDQMIAAVARIADVTQLPVTADIEAGYGASPAAVAETVRLAIDAGAVGVNIEDASGDGGDSPLFEMSLQRERIAAAREAADAHVARGQGAVVNARTDVFWLSVGAEKTRLTRCIDRLEAFREAGADCVFVPRVQNPDLIAEIVKHAGLPLNILASATGPDVGALEALGVARVSVGSGIAREAAAAVQRAARTLLRGNFSELLAGAMGYAEMDAIFTRPDIDDRAQ